MIFFRNLITMDLLLTMGIHFYNGWPSTVGKLTKSLALVKNVPVGEEHKNFPRFIRKSKEQLNQILSNLISNNFL